MLNRFNKMIKNVINNVINNFTHSIYDSSSHYSSKYNSKSNLNKASPYNKAKTKRNIKRLIPVGTLSVICALSAISISAVSVGVWNLSDSSQNGVYWEKLYYKVDGYDNSNGNATVSFRDEAGTTDGSINYGQQIIVSI